MRKPIASAVIETSNKLSHLRETDRKLEVTVHVPRGLDPTGAQEWNRLMRERQGSEGRDAVLVHLTASTFSRVVRMRRLLGRVADRRRFELLIKATQRTYIGACRHLNSTPAVPNRQEIP